MRKGKLRAASATGRRSSGNSTVTRRFLSTKLPKKLRAVSASPRRMPTPSMSRVLSEPGAASPSSVHLSHHNVDTSQDHHHIRDVVAEAHILEHGEIDQT